MRGFTENHLDINNELGYVIGLSQPSHRFYDPVPVRPVWTTTVFESSPEMVLINLIPVSYFEKNHSK